MCAQEVGSWSSSPSAKSSSSSAKLMSGASSDFPHLGDQDMLQGLSLGLQSLLWMRDWTPWLPERAAVICQLLQERNCASGVGKGSPLALTDQ